MLDTSLRVERTKSSEHFEKSHDPKEPKLGTGEFSLHLDITATDRDVYIPLSVASGKKPAGFVYQLEGTDAAALSTASVSVRGEEVIEVTLGTIHYAKVPKGMVADFHVRIEMRGKPGEEYQAVINLIHYKQAPEDARYDTFDADIRSDILKS